MGFVIALVVAVLVAVVVAMLCFLGLIISMAVLLVRLLTGRPLRRTRPPRRYARKPSLPYPLIPAQVRSQPTTAPRQLPPAAREQADRIRQKADGLLRQREQFATGSHQLYVVQRTATDYLPRTVAAYLDLPAGQEATAATPDGRTAQDVLGTQLDLLESRLDEIARDVYRRNLDRLVANGRFLEERFGTATSELDLPVS